MKAYQIGVNQYWTGATMEVDAYSGIPIGWTRSAPPALAKGEYAVWGGGWDVTRTKPQVREMPRKATPIVVPMRNARLALSAAGLLAQVQNHIATMTGAEGEVAQIEWQFAQTVRRDSPLVKAMTVLLAKTEAEIDALFIAAEAYG